MRPTRAGWWLTVVGLLVAGSLAGAHAVERKVASGASTKKKKDALTATKLIVQLDAVLAQQEQIKQAVQAALREAEIVKIRASTPKSCED